MSLPPLLVHCVTSLQRLAAKPTLAGATIALSMSESTEIGRFGFASIPLDNVMTQISRYLLVKGATPANGGHLGPAGYRVTMPRPRFAKAPLRATAK